MFTIDDLADRLGGYLSTAEIRQVKRAFYYAEQAHDGQLRRSGEPYVTHPLAVANILANMHMDCQSLMAAMLHDVLEDTSITSEALVAQFGREVTNLVDGVSKLTKIAYEDRAVAQADNLQKMVLAMSRDIRVIIVKLADRLHNMRTLGSLKPAKKRRIARETLEIYARIANRLGINTMRVELEDLAFRAIYPMRAERIRRAVIRARGNRRAWLRQVQNNLQQCLDNNHLPGTVIGRQKHLLSIYRKMHDQHKSFAELMDVFAFRIITDTVDNCYRILGAVHNLYKPVPGRFKDYIAIPKTNGYQSLHTTLFGSNGYPIEVQIRTRDMETTANNGIAAHWLYKAGQTQQPLATDSRVRAQEWVRGLLEMQRNAGNSLEFIEHVKNDLFPDDVYVFTPRGEIMELPRGATPIDFAYSVHTDIGNSCIACRINRHLASLSQPLNSGQTVEIITAPGAKPHRHWLNFVVTAKARSAIRHFLKHQQRCDSIQIGKRLLNRSLAAFSLTIETLAPGVIEALLHDEQLEDSESLFLDIGLGKRTAYHVARRLTQTDVATLPQQVKKTSLLQISRTQEVLTYARCCFPLPGDAIIGQLIPNEGIMVHRRECFLVIQENKDPEQFIALDWPHRLEEELPTALRLETATRRRLVAELAALIDDAHASIERIDTEEHNPHLSIIRIVLKVHDRVHLARIIKRMRNLPHTEKVIRLMYNPRE